MAIGKSRGTILLEKVSDSQLYGFTKDCPILVGGGFSGGKDNTYQYLNSLLGPSGELIIYKRIGTCCQFETPNSPFGGTALLEVYEINFDGATEPKRLYFYWYDSGELLTPYGLTACK